MVANLQVNIEAIHSLQFQNNPLKQLETGADGMVEINKS
jgi:hypothetical protein